MSSNGAAELSGAGRRREGRPEVQLLPIWGANEFLLLMKL